MTEAEGGSPDEVQLTGRFVEHRLLCLAGGFDVSIASDDVSAIIRGAQEAQTRQGAASRAALARVEGAAGKCGVAITKHIPARGSCRFFEFVECRRRWRRQRCGGGGRGVQGGGFPGSPPPVGARRWRALARPPCT